MSAARVLAGVVLLALLNAPQAAEPALADSRCAGADLVDVPLRDAALQVLQALVVRAPGQPADGAVRAHPAAGHRDGQGHGWQQVSAYGANLGLMGALRLSPQWLPVVEGWLQWQARHIAPTGPLRGVVVDHWVRSDTHEQSTCPPLLDPRQCGHVDAHDSTAASTLLMADAFLRHGGAVALLRQPAMRAALEAAAAALRDLTAADGLTWALPQHPAAYTMDAVEVVAGWRAWSRLQREAYAQPASADNTLALADRAQRAIDGLLWDAGLRHWRVSAADAAPDRSRWYPDTMAQAWPLLWGHQASTRARDLDAWRRAIAPWQRAAGSSWFDHVPDPAGFLWPAAAVAAHCSGDGTAAQRWVAQARRRAPHPVDPVAWPLQVGDLLWLFWLSPPLPRPAAGAASFIPFV